MAAGAIAVRSAVWSDSPRRRTLSKVGNRLKNYLRKLAAVAALRSARWAIRLQPDYTFKLAIEQRRKTLTALLFSRTAGVVAAGPFQGMRIADTASWGDGELAAKLLGSYEEELHAEIESVIRSAYKKVIVVGCAEGYYAVGLARRMPQAEVVAFEAVPEGQSICRRNAELNDASGVSVRGRCDVRALGEVLSSGEPAWLLVDCEGFESQLLDPASIGALAQCDFIVECHDFIDRGITGAIVARFQNTHTLTKLRQAPRDGTRGPLLDGLDELDRSLIVCEFRPEPMHWLVAKRKA